MTPPRITLPALVLLVALAGETFADSWMPFQDKRVVSPSGRDYVVIRSTDRGVSFELCERKEGAPRMKGAVATDKYGLREGSGGTIDRDPEDRVVAKGSVPQLPLEVRVLDGGKGFLLLEKYANVGYGKSLIYVDGKGEIVFAKTLAELFGEEVANGFGRTVSSIWWHQGLVAIEAREVVLLIASGDLLKEVSLANGAVGDPAKEVLLEGLRGGPLDERELCLEVAGRLLVEGLLPEAMALARDDAEPVSIRMRSAVAVKRAGGAAPFDALFLTGTEKGRPSEVRKYAIAHLAEMLGPKAFPVLRELMRGPADNDAWHPAQQAFVSQGGASVPTLIAMLGEEGQSSDYRGGAAHALGKIGSAKAVDALLAATATAPDYVANAAVNAAIAIGADDLGPRLAKILLAGSTQDRRIASYFEQNPAEYARMPLEAALKRAEPDSFDDRFIRDALKALGD